MQTILVEKRAIQTHVLLSELHAYTRAPYAPQLEFQSFAILRRVLRKTAAFHRKQALSKRQLWFGAYFQKEVLAAALPHVSLRWVSEEIGWGVFAERDFQPMEFLAEYSGLFRKREKGDEKNAYCFECPLIRGESSPYLIDAQEKGGISRYINHSDAPNVESALATVLGAPHILLITKVAVPKGAELRYDYGPDYWKRRKRSAYEP